MTRANAYATMKGALEGLTRYQAKELGARGITVNIVAPGAIASLLSPENRWITAQRIEVSGGQML